MLTRAGHAVATSPAMQHYPVYVDSVEQMHFEGSQPGPGALFEGLREVASGRPQCPDLHGLRLTAALVSFVDDYAAQFPAEFFDDRAVSRLLSELKSLHQADVLAVLRLPTCAAQPTTLEAVLVAHAALRQLARGRDDRALTQSRLSLEERLDLGGRMLPFPEEQSRGGDPLGDAYHYFATVAAGLAGTSAKRRLWMLPLFAAGPELMWGVREGLFGARLFYGNHARIDRMGLRHGIRLGRAAASPVPSPGSREAGLR